MNPQDPNKDRYLPPVDKDNIIHSTDPVDHVHHGFSIGWVGRLVRRTTFGLAIVSVLLGSAYGYTFIDGLRKDAQAQLEIAQAIDTAKIYRGNGEDILEVIPAIQTLECSQGYDKSGSGDDANCIKKETVVVEPKVYSCPDGYTSSGEGANLKCSKIVGGQTKTIAATTVSSCPAGLQQSGDQCTKSEQTNERIKSYSCPSGTNQSGEGMTTQCAIVNASSTGPTASCPSGYSASGGSCSRSTGASASTSYYCPSGYTLSGSTCYASKIGTTSRSYSCRSGSTLLGASGPCGLRVEYLDGNYCTVIYNVGGSRYCSGGTVIISDNPYCGGGYTYIGRDTSGQVLCRATTSPSASTSYSCPGGYSLSGSSCYQSTGYNYSCPSGYASGGSGAGMTCSKSNIEYKNVIITEGCPGGFTLTSGRCENNTTVSIDRKTACPDGYILSGTSCSQIVGGETKTITPIVVITKCAADYTTVGSGDTLKCTKNVTKTEALIKSYTCSDGLLKRQTGSVIDCVKVAAS